MNVAASQDANLHKVLQVFYRLLIKRELIPDFKLAPYFDTGPVKTRLSRPFYEYLYLDDIVYDEAAIKNRMAFFTMRLEGIMKRQLSIPQAYREASQHRLEPQFVEEQVQPSSQLAEQTVTLLRRATPANTAVTASTISQLPPVASSRSMAQSMSSVAASTAVALTSSSSRIPPGFSPVTPVRSAPISVSTVPPAFSTATTAFTQDEAPNIFAPPRILPCREWVSFRHPVNPPPQRAFTFQKEIHLHDAAHSQVIIFNVNNVEENGLFTEQVQYVDSSSYWSTTLHLRPHHDVVCTAHASALSGGH